MDGADLGAQSTIESQSMPDQTKTTDSSRDNHQSKEQVQTLVRYYAEEQPFHLWDALSNTDRQHAREIVIKSLGPSCPQAKDGTTMMWTPEGHRNRRLLFDILDSWWANASWEDQNEFQAGISELQEMANEHEMPTEDRWYFMTEELEQMEGSIPKIVVEWLLERAEANRCKG